MKMYLISDNVDTRTGMRLAGIQGCVLHEADEVKQKMEEVLKDQDIGIVLITGKIMTLMPEYFSNIKLNYKMPLIIEIPDRHGEGKNKTSLMSYISDAIGLKF